MLFLGRGGSLIKQITRDLVILCLWKYKSVKTGTMSRFYLPVSGAWVSGAAPPWHHCRDMESCSQIKRSHHILQVGGLYVWTPLTLLSAPPKGCEKNKQNCVHWGERGFFGGDRKSCSILTLLQLPSGWSWSCRTPGFPACLFLGHLEVWKWQGICHH